MKLFKKLAANQKVMIAVLVLAAGLVGFGVTYAVSSNRQGSKVVTPNCSGVCVNLLGKKASPDTLAITKGTYVTFNSADGGSHELTLGDPGEHGHSNPESLESGVFGADEAFRVQFKEDGTYRFTDKKNPEVTIIVVVYTEGKDYKVQ